MKHARNSVWMRVTCSGSMPTAYIADQVRSSGCTQMDPDSVTRCLSPSRGDELECRVGLDAAGGADVFQYQGPPVLRIGEGLRVGGPQRPFRGVKGGGGLPGVFGGGYGFQEGVKLQQAVGERLRGGVHEPLGLVVSDEDAPDGSLQVRIHPKWQDQPVDPRQHGGFGQGRYPCAGPRIGPRAVLVP
ncbi:hypothetical protein GCM10010276_82540 [Streptomyces longisporus]|uniref:Uncharacterized protein n=1 Tax=Streptomyces longisporus TaxID=1948 RepID=A0ABN3NE36_STRLO